MPVARPPTMIWCSGWAHLCGVGAQQGRPGIGWPLPAWTLHLGLVPTSHCLGAFHSGSFSAKRWLCSSVPSSGTGWSSDSRGLRHCGPSAVGLARGGGQAVGRGV